ncbi:MAG TPA: hypothetical protein VIF64_10865 [Pyrinomonadaceae bacterium]|jgi:hypothetical protein
MEDKRNAQTLGGREIVESLDREFARLYAQSCAVIEKTPVDTLYAVPVPAELGHSGPGADPISSVGENVLRCAAAVEQTFGGITSNLWDDPFEWTLPEYLSTPDRVNEHLREVEETRKRAFSSFTDDACLLKRVAVPSGETRPLIDLLLETLLRAADYQARAQFALNSLSGISSPGFII